MVSFYQNTKDKEKREDVDIISMNIPAKPEFVGVARITASSIATRVGFDVEQIEDIKVSVAEACTNAIQHSENGEFVLKFEIYPEKLSISIIDDGVGIKEEDVKEPKLGELKEGGLGIFIIKSLMDDVRFVIGGNKKTELIMEKHLIESF